jgi:hypothetical protein
MKELEKKENGPNLNLIAQTILNLCPVEDERSKCSNEKLIQVNPVITDFRGLVSFSCTDFSSSCRTCFCRCATYIESIFEKLVRSEKRLKRQEKWAQSQFDSSNRLET